MKQIKTSCCKKCPYFSAFPAEYFEGDCAHRKSREKTQDSRITDEDAIPEWCPL